MAARYVQSLRLLDPTVYLYFVTILMVGFALDGGVYAVLFNLYLLRQGYGPEVIGLVNAAGMLTFALTSLPAGALGERWGSQRALLAGLALLLVGSALLPLADLVDQRWRIGWLLVFNAALYAGLALYFVNGAPFLMSIVSAAQRNTIFSTQVALLSLSAFVGSLIGGVLPQVFAATLGLPAEGAAAYRYGLLVAALALLPALLAARAARPGAPGPNSADAQEHVAPTEQHVARALLLRLLMVMALVRLLQVAGMATTSTFFNVYLDAALNVPTAQIGLLAALGRLLATPAVLLTPLLASRYGNRSTALWASFATGVCMLPLALVPHWSAAGLGFIGVVSLSSIRYASSLVYFLELVPPNRRGAVSGATETAGGISFTLLTFSGGYIAALLGYRSLFLLGAALTGLGALAFWICFPKRGGGLDSG